MSSLDHVFEFNAEPKAQGTDEWYQARLGKFTASRFGDMMKRGSGYKSDSEKVNELRARVHAIETGELKKEIEDLVKEIEVKKASKLGVKRLEDKLTLLNSYSLSETKAQLKIALEDLQKSRFSDTCNSYIYEKVGEILTMSPHMISGQAIDWGNEYEEAAIIRYEELNNVKIQRVGFLAYSEMAGSSPDGLVGEDGVLEIKAPFNPKNHAQSLVTQTFYNTDHEWQVQGHLLVTGRNWCDFVTYDPRVQDEALQFNCIRVKRDEEKIEAIKDRLEEVKIKLEELMSKYELS